MDAASWNKSNGNNVEVTRYTSNFESKVVGASGELWKRWHKPSAAITLKVVMIMLLGGLALAEEELNEL